MRNKKKHIIKKICLLCLSLILMVTSVATPLNTYAKYEENGNEIHIYDLEGLLTFVKLSKTGSYEGKTVYLEDDITIDASIYETDDYLKENHFITIGSKDYPFKGHFDGKGHSIVGLRNEKTLLPDFNHALFSVIEGATIENLTLTDARVVSAYIDGILVGEARNSTIRNIIVNGQSQLKVEPANNIVSLVTNLGTRGGAIVGSAENCYIYNCESNQTELYNNTTSGVTGVGGERLRLGGIVGYAEDSTVEYCRVVGGKIENKYDVAVGAVGGKQIFVGGIVGEVENANVIDSFSTASLYYYAANYVSVGSGIAGYIGGIVGMVNGDSNLVERCHFAGEMSSEQVNSILVLPVIIQKNVNLYGVAGRHLSNAELIAKNTFFNRDKYPEMTPVSFKNDYTEDNARGLTDDEFLNRDYWSECGYDFYRTIERVTMDPTPHYNQWVMDQGLGIPVHGQGVAATFNYPDAAKVTITNVLSSQEAASISPFFRTPVSTELWYRFAVQGVSTYQDTVELKTETKSVEGITDAEAFRFRGWYKKDNVTRDSISSDSMELITYVKENVALSDANIYEPTVSNNDLFIADYQGLVTFHDVDGNLIEKAGGTIKTTVSDTDDYYSYRDKLPDVLPAVTPEGCVFYGWTSIPKMIDGQKSGYEGITSDELALIKAEVYQAGDEIEKPMQLYPIYTNFVSNALVRVEGYAVESAGNTDVTIRPTVADATVLVDNGEVSIQLVGLGADGKLPAKYRFLGWYEVFGDGTSEKVSTDMTHQLKNVDLSVVHTYEARFEYQIDYWVKVQNGNVGIYTGETPYKTLWQGYGTGFDSIEGPTLYRSEVHHWAEGNGVGTDDSNYKIPDGDEEPTCADALTADFKIYRPLDAYAHFQRHSGNFDVTIENDFPGAGQITMEGSGASTITFTNIYNASDYTLVGMTFDADRSTTAGKRLIVTGKDVTELETDRALVLGVDYALYSRYTANVRFHKDYPVGENTNIDLVTRRYNEAVFMETAKTTNFGFYYTPEKDTGLSTTSAAYSFSNRPTREGYVFLGWVNKAKMTAAELAHVFDVAGDEFATSSAVKAMPYLMDGSETVTEAMDLYAVYAQIDGKIITTTNIKESAGSTAQYINIPIDPTYVVSEVDDKGYADITLKVDITTAVLKSEPDGTKYAIQYMEMIDADGNITKLLLKEGSTDTFEVQDIIPGQSYKFIAYYEPVVVVYHMDNGVDDIVVKNKSSYLGSHSAADFNLPHTVFLGWTEVEPSGGIRYHLGDYETVSELDLAEPTDYVMKSMELWAVYANVGIKVNSNIDALITDDAERLSLRNYTQTGSGAYKLTALKSKTVGEADYAFVGWYTDYQSDSEPGTLFSTETDPVIPDVYADVTFTAVYKESFVVRYHDTAGNEIYRVHVLDGSRSFMKDGSLIDYEAFMNLLGTLDQQNQMFEQFQWKSGVWVDWDDFKDLPIVQDMDLYPVVWDVRCTDLDGNTLAYGTDYIFDMDFDEGQEKLNLYFVKEYRNPGLKVIVSKYSQESAQEPVNGIPVSVYSEHSENAAEQVQYLIETKNTGHDATEPGIATFILNGVLVLDKKVVDADDSVDTNNQDVFIVTIVRGIEQTDGTYLPSTDEADISTITVTANESRTVKLPYGVYFVQEDMNWAWRYEQEITPSEVAISSVQAKVTIQNKRVKDTWIDGSGHKENVFYKG